LPPNNGVPNDNIPDDGIPNDNGNQSSNNNIIYPPDTQKPCGRLVKKRLTVETVKGGASKET
jgi:hypothetical protein